MKRFFIATAWILALITGCDDHSGEKVEVTTRDSTQLINRPSDSSSRVKAIEDSVRIIRRKDSVLLRLTDNILRTIKNKNYAGLAGFIHPVEGIRFSPYAYIDTVHHVKFSVARFNAQVNASIQDTLLWGEFDGTGDPIKMTLNTYMKRFVYDVDFIKPEKRSVNKFISGGNSLNNLVAVYKNCDFTESHFSGFEEKYGGHDWRTLRLVFKERNKRFYLVGVVHDEWTI
ncbi:MAG TPA: hypothetical protein VFP97_06200 [Chitinophagaceae bacterium]|nr:hypothetical protein [Chitinophagaceae bacterium]